MKITSLQKFNAAIRLLQSIPLLSININTIDNALEIVDKIASRISEVQDSEILETKLSPTQLNIKEDEICPAARLINKITHIIGVDRSTAILLIQEACANGTLECFTSNGKTLYHFRKTSRKE